MTESAQYPAQLVVIALPLESQGLFEREGVPVLYTGLGKINAALTLTRRLTLYRAAGKAPPRVINFGTAGSRQFATGALVQCDRFVQRDMDVRPLGVALGVTPFDSLPSQLQCAAPFADLPRAVCGSGDLFATHAPELACEVLDMEAYALAKVCLLEQAQFACVKYISDGANHGAASDWHASLPLAAAAFWRCYQRLEQS